MGQSALKRTSLGRRPGDGELGRFQFNRRGRYAARTTRLRLAIQAGAEAIADVYFASYRLLDFLPKLHDLDSYQWYVANVMLKEWTVTVAEDDSGIVAFVERRGEEMGHFYTRPDRIGQGVGKQLVEAAKASGVDTLEL